TPASRSLPRRCCPGSTRRRCPAIHGSCGPTTSRRTPDPSRGVGRGKPSVRRPAAGCFDDTVTELPPDPATARPRSGNYDLIVALFCGLLLISNIGATKLIAFGPIITDGGALLFPLTYILGDLLSEVYGFRPPRLAEPIHLAQQIAENVGQREQQCATVGDDRAERDQLGGADIGDQQQAAEQRDDQVVVART